MTVLYVVSDRSGAGKTAVCVTLAHLLSRQGKKVALFRPVAASGADGQAHTDAGIYEKLLGQKAQGWPLARPGAGVGEALAAQIRGIFAGISQGKDFVFVEGDSALSDREHKLLADQLGADALVVAEYRRDLLAAELKRWQSVFGSNLVGVVINGLTRYLGTEARTRLLPSLESEGVRCLGVIPEDRRLLAVSVAQIAEHLNGRFLVCQEHSDRLVEHLMIGSISLDRGEFTFAIHEDKAVIVRGDRPDVQMAALATSTACMIATKGIEPIEYVVFEAEAEEVPLIVVETDTLDTMAALDTLMDRARFDHPLKVERFAELLEQHVGLSKLLDRAGAKAR